MKVVEVIFNYMKAGNKSIFFLLILTGTFLLFACHGCSESEESGVAQDDLPGNQVAEQVVLKGHVVDMELAVTPEQRETGLMGRESLADDEGMLFVMPDEDPFPTKVGFWMKDCLIPIDLIFISRDGFIDSIHEMQPPEPGTPDHELPVYYSNGPVQFAIELRGGLAAEIGLNVGDMIDLRKDYLLQLAD